MSGRLFASLVTVQDAIFAEPRLARIYDLWEGRRVDLPHYLAIAAELGAHSVLDVGCGTGNWACMLAERGLQVTGWTRPRHHWTSPGPSRARSGCGGSMAT